LADLAADRAANPISEVRVDISADTKLPRRLLYVVNEDWAFLLNRLTMARAAQRAGFEVHVATRVNDGASAIEAEGFILHPVPLRRGGISPLSAIPVIAALRKIAIRVKPDIAHHSGLQCCVYGSIAAFGRKYPYVSAMTGMGYVYTSATWQSRLLKAILQWLLPWLLDRSGDIVLVQNPDDRAALIDLGISEKRVTLIPGSGVDTDTLQPLPEPDGPITYGFAGRLLTDKGIRALVAAHDIVRTQGLETNLLIAGNPDPANPASVSLQEVNEWTQRLGITWLGHIKDIASLWRRCHFAILPSHREGLPGSLMEAAACERAMIASDAPGCREIVIDGQTGLLVPIEDPQALARAITTLATSADLRARYAAAARELVVTKLSSKLIGEQIVQLYNDTIAGAIK
jgi:glycosyltransferase involved in cell wall biosynthesis